MTAPITTWSAYRIVAAIAAREVTAEAVTHAYADRIESVDPTLHAYAWFDRGAALRTARALDRAAAGNVLHGLPVAIKDNIDTAAIPTRYGSPIYAAHVPTADAGCVALLRAAGAFVLGKTATTEFANFQPARTLNPRNPEHTPGGSSSGSAAAVAAELAPIALGTQTAGSVIRPAAFCGIVGYKPSPRLIPRAGVKPNSDTLDEVGVLARSVDDAGWFAGVLALVRPNTLPSARAFVPHIGVTQTSRGYAASEPMRAAIDIAADRLAAAGARVGDAVWPAAFDRLFDAQRTIQLFETARALGPEWQHHRGQLSTLLQGMMSEGHTIDGARYAEAIEIGRASFAAIESLFSGRDVLITPAAPGEAPFGNETTGNPIFNRPWQLLRCPCVTVPCGEGLHGLPLGLQIIGRPGDDQRLLAAAAWIERALGA